ncbi:MAG: FtsW/RodA/SpoVE family cell cycle protein [Candidatus Cloacimonadaceae bacterium]|jgi:cell division protein FtsW (lipid II flippase)|nr:FtsW/RodA/SpoVE family cell cycle protein [Candidatus Cloacimonadota bacterium]MDX9950355.1 FtsW/RodA/SpoVE family cell cycle protein [Candidatus Syntrophosphaera sp.]NLN84515.1 FtsW/RodA/SpoVE family cell cycle protein [Candidatus Cloacimonadota bacterium]
MKKNRSSSVIVSIDNGILICYLLLCLVGLIVMLDITSIQSSMAKFYRHSISLGASIMAAIVTMYFFNVDKARPLNRWLIFLIIGLLLAVLLFGVEVNGAKRWLKLGPFLAQPSTFARLVLVMFFAGYLDLKQDKLGLTNVKNLVLEFIPLIAYTGIIYIFILLERHLSTLIISGMTLLGMLFYAGLRKRFVMSVVLVGLLGGVMIISMGDSFRSDRIRTFKVYSLLVPKRPEPANTPEEYQVRESLTALTSGHLVGTGISRGRAKHYFLPEARTDYVYTIIGEEFGFLGAAAVLLMHAWLFFRILKLAEKQENNYHKYLCAGLGMNIFFNALINTGVSMSIIPATGNTLPFVSYGGTALLVDSISIGLILNISAKRRQV